MPDHKTSEDGSVHVDQPIFLDPQGRRRMWLRLLSGVTTGTGVFAVAACGLLFSEGPSASTGSLALPGKGVAFPRMMDDKVAYLSDGGRSSALMDGGDSTSPTARADDVSDEQAPPESSTTVAEPIGGGSTASVERLPTERDQVAEADIDGSEGTDPGNDAGAGEGTASDVAGTGKTDVEEIDGDDLRETEPPEAATSVEEAPEQGGPGGSGAREKSGFREEDGARAQDDLREEGGAQEESGVREEDDAWEGSDLWEEGDPWGESGAQLGSGAWPTDVDEDIDVGHGGTEPENAVETPTPAEVPQRYVFPDTEWFSIVDDPLVGLRELRD